MMRARLTVAIAVIAGIAVTALAFYQFVFGDGCIFLSLFGIPCPSCGMTRAMISLLNGRVSEAFGYHPLFMTPFLISAFGVACIPLKRCRRCIVYCILAVLAAFIAVWIVRTAFFDWRG